jgi:hypothetical protein
MEDAMKQILAVAATIGAILTILAIGEPALQQSASTGAQAQHNRCVRDQACYRRCRNDSHKSSRACCRLCRG